MRSTSATCALAAICAFARAAGAQQPAEGFAVERFYPSAPGGGWLVADDLSLSGGLGGAASLTLGYARRPLRVEDGLQHATVVSDQSFAQFALAATYDRFRMYIAFASPIAVAGNGGAVGGYRFTAPSANLEQNPDTVSDPRIGFDARILGGADAPFRLGAGAQLIVPSGLRADYLTDGTYRAMVRVLFAGDVGRFSYAGQGGVHVRPLDQGAVPGGPRGSELLFGIAGGARLGLGGRTLVVGPEIYGETALRSLFASQTTGIEALFSARLEGARGDTAGYRFKMGLGGGLHPQSGAPVFRVVAGVELFGRAKDP